MDPFPKGTRVSQEFRSSPGGFNPPGGHTGRDYAVPVGTPVRAACDGIIRHSSWFTDNYAANDWWLTRYGGDTLVLDGIDAQGRTVTMPTFVYAHLLDSTAPVGARVKKGQVIGYSGNSGTATTGPHCHVERLNPGFDLTNSVYGRAPLGFDEYYSGGIVPQGAVEFNTLEDIFMAYTDKERDEILTAARKVNRYLDAPTGAIPAKVWATTVLRGGGKVSALQELADAKTNAEKIAALVTAQIAASKNSNLTAAQITDAVKKALDENVVTVDVNVNGVGQ